MTENPPLFQIQDLAYRSPEAIETLLGAPIEIAPNAGEQGEEPGETRTYPFLRNSEVSIQFTDGQAVSFTLWFDLRGSANPSTPEAAVAVAGIDVEGMILDRSGASGRWWRGESGGLTYSRVGATRSDVGTGWTCVLIRLERAPGKVLVPAG
jgi:hypothetical protein